MSKFYWNFLSHKIWLDYSILTGHWHSSISGGTLETGTVYFLSDLFGSYHVFSSPIYLLPLSSNLGKDVSHSLME